MRRWLYYFELAWCDLVRLWATTQHHVIIVAGICLPILMLLGLKRGHVEALRQDLITSPTGRQITFWSAQKGELLDRKSIDRLTGDLPSVEIVVPETQRVVTIHSAAGASDASVDSVTLFATREGDPMMSQLGIRSPKAGTHEVILGQAVADELKVRQGDTVEVVISRGRSSEAEMASVSCKVAAVMPTEEHSALIGYVDLDLLDQFDAFGRGFRVPELGWSSARVSAVDTYSGYLFFCEKTSTLTEDDRRYLGERGFRLEHCTDNPPEPLRSLLIPDFSEGLVIYRAHTAESEKNPSGRLRIPPSELSEATEADDVVLAWNEPKIRSAADGSFLMAGISFSRRAWLREYFSEPSLAFDYEAEPFSFHLASADAGPTAFDWPLTEELSVPLSFIPIPKSSDRDSIEGADESPRQPTAEGPATEPAANPTAEEVNSSATNDQLAARILVVPANLLAWIQEFGEGRADFDTDIKLFVPRQEPAVYDRARLYAMTIDDVPSVVDSLADSGFAVMSETGRITEIHRQDDSLQLLVFVVGAGVFLFGVVTVFSVLMESTDRKRGTIGVLRVMGMSRSGIFASILVRATAIGAAAALVSLLCGFGLRAFLGWTPPSDITWLQWKPIVTVMLAQNDLILVTAGAMLCCGLGAIPPAWRASRLDPFDAIVEGRFR